MNMKKINLLSSLVILAILLVFLCLKIFLIRIELGQVGVRTMQYDVPLFCKKGVEPKDFGPGWHRRLPLIDSWTFFDSTVQTMEYATQDERQRNQSWAFTSSYASQRNLSGDDPVELKTDDGYSVKLDVTVKYCIRPKEVYLLFQRLGSGDAYKQIVSSEARGTMRDVFGGLKTEQFYDPIKREAQTVKAERALRDKMKDRSVDILAILIRNIEFDPNYERKILDKKLADQDVELNKSKALAEAKRGETNKILAETEAKVLVINQQKEAEVVGMKADMDKKIAEIQATAQLQVAKTRADADLYAAKNIAQGMLLEKTAEAEGERLKATALQGSGGNNYVAMQLVHELKLGAIALSTLQTDFLNVDTMVRKLGAAE
jgi:regulator of protease activity HflC (stomatin/prohibitin superfamily)